MRVDVGDQIAGAIKFIEERADEWRGRIASHESGFICEGSDFSSDSPLPGGVLPAHLAWRALAAGAETLILLDDVGRLTDGGVYFRPFMILGRTALIGASKAYYLLSVEDSDDRRLRFLQVLKKEFEDLRRLNSDLRNSIPEESHDDTVEAWISDCREEISALGGNPKESLTDTRLIEVAAAALTGAFRDPTYSVLSIWRSGSGAAHAQSWVWDFPFAQESEAYQLAAAASIPAGILEFGWDRWNDRRLCEED